MAKGNFEISFSKVTDDDAPVPIVMSKSVQNNATGNHVVDDDLRYWRIREQNLEIFIESSVSNNGGWIEREKYALDTLFEGVDGERVCSFVRDPGTIELYGVGQIDADFPVRNAVFDDLNCHSE